MTFSHFDFQYIDTHCYFFPEKFFKAIWITLADANFHNKLYFKFYEEYLGLF